MTHFHRIEIISTDDNEDFRAACYCVDNDGNEWALLGYGASAASAADSAWKRYLDYENWASYGFWVE